MSERKPSADRELEDFLAGRDAASQAYRDTRALTNAPNELDRVVLAMARTDLEQRRLRRRSWRSLRLPVALAATVVLSFSLLPALIRETPEPEGVRVTAAEADPAKSAPAEPLAAPAPAVAEEALPAAPAPQRKSAASAKREQQAFAAPPPAAASEQESLRDSAKAAPSAAPSAAQAPAAEMQRSVAPPAPLGGAASRPEGGSRGDAAQAPALESDAWLAEIRRLRDDGDEAAARRSLAHWRERYPEAPVPEDLRRLLAPP